MGIAFPLILGLLSSLNPTIRGTTSSLANSIMYAATTLGSWIAGLIYAAFNGFSVVSIFAAICFAGSLLSFILSGILTRACLQTQASHTIMDARVKKSLKRTR